MNSWEALLLGVVQGATEFLPISSSGHLVLSQALLGVRPTGIFLEVVLHVATVLAVIVYFRTRLAWLVSGCVRRDEAGTAARSYALWLLIGTVPAAIVGVFFDDAVGALFDSTRAALWGLLVTGAILFSSRWARARARRPEGTPAVVMGLAQAVAIVPGVSRSGATIAAGMWSGMDRGDAAEFSFLLSIPAIGGAAALQVIELVREGMPAASPFGLALVIGFVAALLSGYGAIAGLLGILKRWGLLPFAWYCWAVGIAGLILLRG